jgi:PAS domain S-box-containing protein
MKHYQLTPAGGIPAIQRPANTTTGRVRALQATLRCREAILSAVAFASTRFLNDPSWEKSIADVLARLGQAAEVSRVYIFEMFADAEGVLRISQRYEWAAPGIKAEIDNPELQNMDVLGVGLTRWAPALLAGEPIHGIVADFPEVERALLAPQDILSIAIVPVITGDECWGFLGFDECLSEREWGTELDALRTAASTLGGALTRQRYEQELRESEERFRRLSEASREGVLVHDIGVVLDANARFAEIFGYTLDEIIGKNVLDFLTDPASTPEVRARMRAGSEETYEMIGVRKDGTRIMLEGQGRAAMYRGRKVRIATLRDITDRKLFEIQSMELMREQAARAAAEDSSLRAEFLAEASRVLGTSFDYETTLATLARLVVPRLADFCAVDILDGDGIARRVGVAHRDRSMEPLLRSLDHFTVDDLSGTHPLMKVLTQGEPVLISPMPEGFLDSMVRNEARRDILRDLGLRAVVSVPLLSSGRVIGSLSLMGSERRFDEHDLALAIELARRAALAVDNARLYQAAEQATRARDDMLGVVAHDLRNPLSTIVMSASLLLELPPDIDGSLMRRQIEVVQRAANRMNRLIQDLLDVRRIDGGQLALDTKPESVSTVVNEAVEMLRPLAAANSLALTGELASELPRVLVDAPRILQVMSNLVGNAVKFTPPGGSITLRARPAEREVRFTVADTGPGIAAEQLPHLFGRYWQGDRKDRRGIGLGLAIAKGIVEAHGGRIWVESTIGEGSDFHFTLQSASDDAVQLTS